MSLSLDGRTQPIAGQITVTGGPRSGGTDSAFPGAGREFAKRQGYADEGLKKKRWLTCATSGQETGGIENKEEFRCHVNEGCKHRTQQTNSG
jgi:hypothetical protein